MKRKISAFLLVSGLLFTISTLTPYSAGAQCPMCKANVESAIKNKDGKRAGLGLNTGITMLLATPYLAFAVIGLIWYRNTRGNNRKARATRSK